jgi:hypothetical protein
MGCAAYEQPRIKTHHRSLCVRGLSGSLCAGGTGAYLEGVFVTDRLLRQLLEWRDYEYCEGEQPYELLMNAVDYAHDLLITANTYKAEVAELEALVKDLQKDIRESAHYQDLRLELHNAKNGAATAYNWRCRAETAESRLADIEGLPEKWRAAEPYYGVGGRVEQNRCADELQAKLKGE